MKRVLGTLILLGLFLPCIAVAQGYGRNGMKKGSWRSAKDIPQGWHVMKSGRYVFQSNVAKDRVKKVAKHLNAAYRLYEKTFRSGRTPKKPFVVKIFKNRKEFIAYGAPQGAGAYYSWHDKEMVGYDTGKLDGVVETETTKPAGLIERMMAKNKMDLLGVFAHEGWHQYFHFICASKVDFPSWCDEGIGEYFYSMRVRDGKYVLGAPNDYRLSTIKRHIKRNSFIPLQELVTLNQREYYGKASLAYAQGWSLVHFFLEHPTYKKKRYLKRFVKAFISDHSIDKAVTRVFTRMNWEKTTEEWKAWVKAMKLPAGEGDDEESEEAIRRGLEELLRGKSGKPGKAAGGGK